VGVSEYYSHHTLRLSTSITHMAAKISLKVFCEHMAIRRTRYVNELYYVCIMISYTQINNEILF